MKIEKVMEDMSRKKRDKVKELQFFDANIWLGEPDFFPIASELHPNDLEEVCSKYHLEGGLISHWDSPKISAQDGNHALLELQEYLPEAIYTIWTGLPLSPHEQDPLPGFNAPPPGLRGVRLFPKTHKYLLSPWVIGTLCEWCIRHAVPLFFWHIEVDWNHVYVLAKKFPKLNIIVETQWQKILYHNRNLYSLMESCNNVLLETSNFIGQDFITHAVKTFGAERLIFGSFLPVNDPFASMGMILDADISDNEKKMISGGNLRQIIKGVRV